MYANTNYKTKKSIREAIAKNGDAGGIHQPGPFGGTEPSVGVVSLEGPHYPEAHRWYARATIVDGLIVKIS